MLRYRWAPEEVFLAETVYVEELQSLKSKEEEADSLVVLYLLYTQKVGSKQATVGSLDSDRCFILLHYVEQLKPLTLLDAGNAVNKKLLNITDIAQGLGPKCCTSHLALCCFTSEDCNCDF